MLTEVFRQVRRDSVTVDDALASVVREDFFRHHLTPRPRLVGKLDHVKEGPKKKRLPQPLPRDASGKKRGKVGECFDWAAGKCKRLQRRFPHACAICVDSAHSSKDCPKSTRLSVDCSGDHIVAVDEKPAMSGEGCRGGVALPVKPPVACMSGSLLAEAKCSGLVPHGLSAV